MVLTTETDRFYQFVDQMLYRVHVRRLCVSSVAPRILINCHGVLPFSTDELSYNFPVTNNTHIIIARIFVSFGTVPGWYLSAQVKNPPCLHNVAPPHRSFTTIVSLTGLSLYSQARKFNESQYVSGASHSPSDHTISGL